MQFLSNKITLASDFISLKGLEYSSGGGLSFLLTSRLNHFGSFNSKYLFFRAFQAISLFLLLPGWGDNLEFCFANQFLLIKVFTTQD